MSLLLLLCSPPDFLDQWMKVRYCQGARGILIEGIPCFLYDECYRWGITNIYGIIFDILEASPYSNRE